MPVRSRERRSLERGVLAVAALVAVTLIATTARAQAATPAAFAAPVYAGDFPDPSVLYTGGTYWAYATGAGVNVQVTSSPDLRAWSARYEALPRLPGWASGGLTWAPSVIQRGLEYVMYYTVHDPALGMQCISVAWSVNPGGPFIDNSGGPTQCQTADHGSIDPNAYVDPATGQLYMIWKSDDNAAGRPTHIWAQAMSPDGLTVAAGSTAHLLLNESVPWQAPSMEGPTMVRHGRTYYLFYGANGWSTPTSGIGYATAPSVLGPWTNQSVSGPWVGSAGAATGPQGPMVFTDSTGAPRMAFAAWYGRVGYAAGGRRAFWIGRLGFTATGRPALS